MPKFVKPKNSDVICIQFHCSECKKQFITTIDDFSKSFVCSRCKAIVNTLPIFCQYEGCPGRYSYFRCGGTIKRLTDQERLAEERKILSSEPDISVGSRPTDSFHDEMGDIQASVITYKCEKCGDSYSLQEASRKGVDSGNAKCQRIVCDTCGRYPVVDGLPEPDEGADNNPLTRFYFNY